MAELRIQVVRDEGGRLSGWLCRDQAPPRAFSGTLDLLAGIDELLPPPPPTTPPGHQGDGGHGGLTGRR
jgi:hypothetical protein